jgi:hypothetical protein
MTIMDSLTRYLPFYHSEEGRSNMSCKKYLQKRTKISREIIGNNKELPYSCFEEFVLENGKKFKNHKEIKVERGKKGECFKNAFHLADNKGLIYVEGVVTISGSPLPGLHAWCVDKEGNVYDPTLEEADEYYGVPFDLMYVEKTILREKTYGVIDNYEMGFPLLRGEHKNFLNKEILGKFLLSLASATTKRKEVRHMGYIKGEDIRGYYFNNTVVCNNCVTPEDLNELQEDQIITETEMTEDDYYFCDRCKKQL